MNSTPLRLLGIPLLLSGLWLAYTQQPPPQDLSVTKIADDLHVIVGSGGNVAVYTTDDGAILVDDKFERNFAAIMEKVKTITDKPVRYLLNTHLHGDHSGGNAKFLGAGTEIILHENARSGMEEKKMPGIPRLSFADRFSINLAGKQVTARHFGRGHTNGDAFIQFPARRVIHTGDMFVAGSPFIDYSSGGSGVDWTTTIDAVLRLDFDTVIPGHGPVMTKQQLADWKASFVKVKTQISSLRAQGKTKEETEKLVDLNLPGWSAGGLWGRSYPGLWDELAR
jgi:glyoxylase-like metal-dependent hydrolase (beta-lactamase superfamily II)